MPCPTDLAEPPDGNVDISDVVAIIAHFGEAVPPAPAKFDLDPSGFVDISDVTFVTEDFGITACSGSFVSFNPPAYNEGALLSSSPINCYFYYWRWKVADNIQIGYSWFQRLGQGFCNSFGVLGQTHYECYDKVWRHDPYNGGWSIVDQSPISTVHPPNSSNVYCGEMGPLQRYRYHGFNLCYHAWDVFGNDTGWICFTPAGSYVYVV